ncbi:chromosome segregation protein [Psychrobacter sp. PL15]|uniref:AAA family ATPase n=1 Tax=Psychrobacter sp. PL15 TaxID=3071719 RepID=UPI002E0395CF|nr:chromosome segregation protein [Psychrobacter sp. PL15]
MRLKSLKLAGFKSFANATTFTFPRGITAIVGPNGCGKSNVIDAIRWVLGETSAKQLRGGAMSDVIFAGTQDKAAKSVASVELTFEHTQDEQMGIRHEFNLYQELSVRRQVNLEGRSDYFINGTRCRRRDVIDVFLGTGLGSRSYAVIEQGMIGRIVDSNPMQLREFIEEAAGVSRYQARRDETQKKLEKTKDNLARLYDVQSELERQQKTLSKQAASAQHHAELAETLADIKQQLAIQQLYQAKQSQQQYKAEHERSVNTVARLQANYDQLKTQQDKLTARINQEQWLKDDAQSAHYQQQLSYQHAEHQLNDGQAQLDQIKQQLADLEQQREQAIAEINDLEIAQAQQQTELAKLRPQLVELTAKRDTDKRDEQPLQRTWYESQNKLTHLQDSERLLEQQQALNTQSQHRLQLSQDKWARRQQNWQDLWVQSQQATQSQSSETTAFNSDNVASGSQTTKAQIVDLDSQLQQINRQQDSVEERLSELQPQERMLQQRLAEQQRALTEHEKRHALLAGEYDAIHQVLHPKPTNNSQQQTANANSDLNSDLNSDSDSKLKGSFKSNAEDKVVSDYQPLPITTLREQIELSAQGQQYAHLLDSLLALWLDSHVLLLSQHNVHDNAQRTASLSSQFKRYLPELLAYQNGQKQQDTSENCHSLWLPVAHAANQNDSRKNDFIDTLPGQLKDNVFSLSQLIAQPTLALWQQCYLYIAQHDNNTDFEKNAQLTLILQALPSSALLLTTDGWLISSSGTINLSKFVGAQDEQADSQSNSQFLTQRLNQRQRLENLATLLDEREAQITTQQQTLNQNQREYDTLVISLEETRAQADNLIRNQYQCQQQLTTQQAARDRQQADVQRLNFDKTALAEELQELEHEQKSLDREQLSIEQDRNALMPKLAEARAICQQLQADHNQLNRVRQIDTEAWQALQLSIQQSDIRLEHSVSSLARATDVQDKAIQNQQTLIARLKSDQQQLPALQAALQTAQTARDQQQALLTEREIILTALKHEYSEQQAALDTLQTEVQVKQSKLASDATELALSEARLNDASNRAHESLAEYYQLSNKSNNSGQTLQTISVSSLLTDFITHERRVRPDKIADLYNKQNQLEQQLNKIGAVNLAAVAELSEVNQRLAPLAQQTEDIAASMNTLTNAIASIDETTKALFMQTLEAVNIDLADLFAKVFGGGHASLTLNLDDMPTNSSSDKDQSKPYSEQCSEPCSEQWRAGLTLMAQPKGKRNSRLAVLSGGEKTLTALSLIFAIFKQHPAPFCVLDEVDAPLDDANVARFTSLIHELANDLQFIFISHNKLAMQIADELKGITMPSPGISTLVSVSLEEAAHYIES